MNPAAPMLDPRAACAGRPSWWWFAEPVERARPTLHERKAARVATETAIKVCTDCPVLASCQRWGMTNEPHGVWGGLTPDERVALGGVGWSRDPLDPDDVFNNLRDRFRDHWHLVGRQIRAWLLDGQREAS